MGSGGLETGPSASASGLNPSQRTLQKSVAALARLAAIREGVEDVSAAQRRLVPRALEVLLDMDAQGVSEDSPGTAERGAKRIWPNSRENMEPTNGVVHHLLERDATSRSEWSTPCLLTFSAVLIVDGAP